MSGSGNTFSTTVSGFTTGETISYACKFAFAGGMAVTKYFSYQVGDVCALSFDALDDINGLRIYPNPAKEVVYLTTANGTLDKLELYLLSGKKIKDYNPNIDYIQVDDLSSGLYLLKVYKGDKHEFLKLLID
jgi:hypothetical protein